MRGVGDEPAALLLRGLQPACEPVELLCQLGQLVMAFHGHPVVIFAGPDGTDAPQKRVHPSGDPGGKDGEEGNDHHPHYQGSQAEVALDLAEQDALAVISLPKAYRARHTAPGHHRGGGPAVEGAVQIPAGKSVVALKSGDHLAGEKVPAHLGDRAGIVKDQPRLVGDQDAVGVQLVQGRDGLLQCLGGELIGRGQTVDHHGHLIPQSSLLGAEHQVLGHQQRIGIQQHQQQRDDQDIAHGQPQLHGMQDRGTRQGRIHGTFLLSLCARGQRTSGPIRRQSSSLPPTWSAAGMGSPGPPPPSPGCGGCVRPPSGTPRYIHSPRPG